MKYSKLGGMKAYSMDLRERIAGDRRGGERVETVAQRFGVCTKTVRVYEKRAAQGRLAPTPRRSKATRLSQEGHQTLRALVAEESDWTLPPLSAAWQERTGQEVPPTTLRDALHRLETTHKKRAASP